MAGIVDYILESLGSGGGFVGNMFGAPTRNLSAFDDMLKAQAMEQLMAKRMAEAQAAQGLLPPEPEIQTSSFRPPAPGARPPEPPDDIPPGMSPARRPMAPEPAADAEQQLARAIAAKMGSPMVQPKEFPLTEQPAAALPMRGGAGGSGSGLSSYEDIARRRFGPAYEMIVGRAMAEAAARKDRLEARRETSPRQMRANAAYGRIPPMRNLQIMQARASGPRNAQRFQQSGPTTSVEESDGERQRLAQAIAAEFAKFLGQTPQPATAFGGGGFNRG